MLFRRRTSPESETSLLQRAGGWPGHATVEGLTAEVLQGVTQREGVDFATALLFDRFQKSPRHAGIIRRIDALRRLPTLPLTTIGAKVVLIPGALYVERPDLGGDGRLVKETVANFGWPYEVIPVASAGSISENAGQIHEWLVEHAGEKIILVSLSKGGADLRMALAAPDAPSFCRGVVAWINVCGPLNGSLMADWVLASRLRTAFFRTQFWLQNRDFNFITGLRHDSAVPRHLSMPPNIRILNIIGFPLRHHMTTAFSRFCHRTLSAYGPNDGTTLLADLIGWPGTMYPVWGADHYFRPESSAREIISATLRYLRAETSLEARLPASETLAVGRNV